jgi:alkyl hydroperoxide reductase subunit AhpF
MSLPVLFIIDDERGIAQALSEDLDRRFGNDYRVACATSPAGGLAVLRDLAARDEVVALVVADHDMAEMPGVDFLAREHKLHPLAKRGLTLYDALSGTTTQVAASALFVLIGGEPRTRWLNGAVQFDGGYIATGRDVCREPGPGRWPLERLPLTLERSLPGVFAAGDARSRSIKRVASAVGDGATAVRLVQE